MEADLRQRLARIESADDDELDGLEEPDSPYDHPLIMPLRQFIEEPTVDELLHNGAALQVFPPSTSKVHEGSFCHCV